MKISTADLRRILDPNAWMPEEARRQETLRQSRLLGDLTPERLRQGVPLPLEPRNRSEP